MTIPEVDKLRQGSHLDPLDDYSQAVHAPKPESCCLYTILNEDHQVVVLYD